MSDDMDSGMFAQLQCALEEKKLEIKELQAIIDKLKEEQRTDTKNSEIFKLSEKVLRKMSIKGLTDAFITLFEEADWCSNNKTNSKGIEFFLEKYRSTAELIKNQRLSSKNFEIIQKIGQGTFSDIFLAKLIDDSGEKPYVIKRIQKSQTFSESSYVWPTVELDVFVLASRLDSPGIAVLDSAFQDPYYLYFALDFYIGGDLLGLLERKEQFSESWALFYFAEMAIGVNTLHGLGYIHRDIKAQNFLLHSSGHVVLTGFGSACRMTNRKSDQAIYVTTEYMSPELVRMLRGEHVVYGPSVDWWSLGVILYEMLVGSTPFSGEEVNAFTLTYRITNHKTEFSFPPGACVSEATQQLIKGLIEEEQARMNFEDIKNHEVFKKVDWQSAVENLRDLSTTKSSGLNVPFKPEFVGAFDTTFFDEYEKEDLCAYISEYRHEYHFGNFLPYMEFYYQRTAKTTGSPAAKKQKPAASSAKLSKISSGNVGVQHKEKKEKEIVERSREMEPFVRTNKNRRVNFDHETLFFEYVKQNDIDNVKLMVERGMASVDAQTKSFSQSPLHIACMFNAYEVAVFLVEQGAPLNQQDDFLCTPLHLALDAGSKKLSLYLLACGADVTIPDGENLKVTEKTQDPEILDALLMFRRRVIYNNISLKNFAEKKGFSYNCMSTVANESNNFKDPFNVQLLDDRLHKYLFGDKVYEVTKEKIKIATRLLERHNLGTQRLKPFPPVDQLELPPLDGDVITYLNDVAQKQCEPYKQYSMNLSTLKPSPMPKEWRLSSGWTRYDTISSGAAAKGERVSAPLGNAMVFDVEVNFRESQYPVIAVALCYENVQQDGQDPDSTFVNGVWYSWCSSNLVSLPGSRESIYKRVNELIPLSRRKPHLIVGHNICYDRARLECEYTFEESNNRFLDTMSMHISLNGLTAAQKRLLLKLRKATALGTASEEKLVRIRDMWTKVAALNSLKDVYRLYIKKELDKTARDLFVEGSLEDIKENAQDCFRYCAADVLATLEVYQKMYDQYFEACPSPATFAGTLLLSTPVLPVKKATFEYYIARCDAKLKETEEMVIGTLKKLLNEALKKNPSEIEKDPFLNHLDWSLPKGKLRRHALQNKPKWYRDLCDRTGTPVMTLRKRITPYLLRMRWDGFPIYYHKPNRTWGFDHPTTGFHQLPRRDKEHAKTGTPLAKTFQFEIEQSKLKGRQEAIPILNAAIETSYWIGTRKRANEQFIHDDIIIPMLVPSGTITRRAVEPLWLTASSPKMNRIGSELKAQVRAPKGYYFVGSDVDSQELWIAAVLGDAYFTGLHGSTALGWMTVSGEKSFKTDLHSRTAEQIAVSRDVAKIFNYGRIYGSGVSSARRMLINSIPDLTLSEADEKAHDLYKSTKGHKVMCTVKYDSERFSELYVWRAAGGCSSLLWVGGSESHMFNSLEQVVNSTYPRTPFLGSGISNMLKSSVAGSNYSTSRVNWVVQSSAVDFLHLLLVSMEHFCKRYCIRYKFVISIHDEVRFLVSERDRYRAALALHLSNLYVRAYFSMRLGMHDLPMSVAFFSKVDVDKVLRKEVNLESVTPSNPIPLPCVGESLSIYEVLKKTNGSLLLNKQPPLESTEAVDRAWKKHSELERRAMNTFYKQLKPALANRSTELDTTNTTAYREVKIMKNGVQYYLCPFCLKKLKTKKGLSLHASTCSRQPSGAIQ